MKYGLAFVLPLQYFGRYGYEPRSIYYVSRLRGYFRRASDREIIRARLAAQVV